MKRFVFGLVLGAAMSAGLNGTLHDVAASTSLAIASFRTSVAESVQSIEDAGTAIHEISTAGE